MNNSLTSPRLWWECISLRKKLIQTFEIGGRSKNSNILKNFQEKVKWISSLFFTSFNTGKWAYKAMQQLSMDRAMLPFQHCLTLNDLEYILSNALLLRRWTRLDIERLLYRKVWRNIGTKSKPSLISTGPVQVGQIWKNRCTLDWLLGSSSPGFPHLFQGTWPVRLSTGRLTTIQKLPLVVEPYRSLLMMLNTPKVALCKIDDESVQ